MAKLRNMLALFAVVLHLAALLVSATAHAAIDHAADSHGRIHVQANHHAQPDDACCTTAGSDTPHASDAFCAICAMTCAGMKATLGAVGQLPFVHSPASHLVLAKQTLPSAAPEAAIRPPRARS